MLLDLACLNNYLPKADAAAFCTNELNPLFFMVSMIPRTVIGLPYNIILLIYRLEFLLS